MNKIWTRRAGLLGAGGIPLLLLGWALYAPRPALACNSLRHTFLNAYAPIVPNLVGSRIDSCLVCHVRLDGGDDFLNRYGDAVHNLKPSSVPICDLTRPDPDPEPNRPLPADADDTDADGFSNIQEVKALTFPGFAFDRPRVGDVSSTSTVFGNQIDPDPTNNAATAVITISP